MATSIERDEQVNLLMSRYKDVIQRLYDPEAVWLFGSRAGGDVSANSDIDLLVVSKRFDQVRRLRRRSTFLRETGLAQAYDLPVVDPLCYTPDEFRAGLRQPTIVAEAVATGVQLLASADAVQAKQ
jgi:predicted nucleotidyltransferase